MGKTTWWEDADVATYKSKNVQVCEIFIPNHRGIQVFMTNPPKAVYLNKEWKVEVSESEPVLYIDIPKIIVRLEHADVKRPIAMWKVRSA
jgi:ribosomal protein L11